LPLFFLRRGLSDYVAFDAMGGRGWLMKYTMVLLTAAFWFVAMARSADAE
jgi:hypothetical protein